MIKTLNGLQDISQDSKFANGSWLYLRLFYTETSLSWSSSDFWYRNMPLAFFIVMATGLASLLLIRRRWSKARSYIDNWTIAATCLVVIPAFTALVFMIGKYSLLPLQGVVEMNGPGCCTQGLYSHEPRCHHWFDTCRSERVDKQTVLSRTTPKRPDWLVWPLHLNNYNMWACVQVGTIWRSILKVHGPSGLKKTIRRSWKPSMSDFWRPAIHGGS